MANQPIKRSAKPLRALLRRIALTAPRLARLSNNRQRAVFDPVCAGHLRGFCPKTLKMADVKELFETFDADGSGRISTQEVAGLLAKLGAPKPAAAVAALVAQVDTDGDGEVSYAEFEAMLRSQADLAHIVQDKRQAIKQLHVRQGAGNSQHSFSSEEAEAFTEVLNSRLGGDAALAAVLPLAQDAADPPLFAACADGVLLCKLVALIDGDAVDLRAVNMGALGRAADRKATFKVVENCNLAINAAKDVGCRVTNIGPRDIMTARPHLVLGLLWQAIRLLLTQKISLKEHPGLVALLEGDETLQQLLALPPERILVRWLNYHLARAGSARRVAGFGRDLMDSEVYAVVMQQLYGAEVQPVDLTTPDLEARAARVLANAAAVGVAPFIKPRDVAAGNAKLNLAFVAQLFNDRPGLEVVADEAVARELAGLDLDDAGDTREARTFKLWMNSLEAWAGPDATDAVQIRDLFAECRDGVPLLATMDAVRPGCVPWKKVRLAPKNRHHVVENGNRVVAVGRGLDLVLVNIGGVDIADGNKKLILAVVWQLMRQQTVDMLKQLKGDGTAVDEADLVAWANAKVAAFAGATQPPIRSLNDKKLATGRFCVELCAAVGGDVVDWDLVTPGATDEDRALNAKYALSIARKVGARVFCTPDDIVEVKPKMILLFIAALWQAELSGATRPSLGSEPTRSTPASPPQLVAKTPAEPPAGAGVVDQAQAAEPAQAGRPGGAAAGARAPAAPPPPVPRRAPPPAPRAGAARAAARRGARAAAPGRLVGAQAPPAPQARRLRGRFPSSAAPEAGDLQRRRRARRPVRGAGAGRVRLQERQRHGRDGRGRVERRGRGRVELSARVPCASV